MDSCALPLMAARRSMPSSKARWQSPRPGAVEAVIAAGKEAGRFALHDAGSDAIQGRGRWLVAVLVGRASASLGHGSIVAVLAACSISRPRACNWQRRPANRRSCGPCGRLSRYTSLSAPAGLRGIAPVDAAVAPAPARLRNLPGALAEGRRSSTARTTVMARAWTDASVSRQVWYVASPALNRPPRRSYPSPNVVGLKANRCSRKRQLQAGSPSELLILRTGHAGSQ